MIRIGDFRVDRVLEWEGPFVPPEELFPQYPAGLAESIRHWAGDLLEEGDQRRLRMSFHSFLLRTGRHTILVDACCGNGKERAARPQGHRLNTDYLGELARHGVQPEEVDFVMCTHLHWDHVGWNTRRVDGRWVPTFPNARYVMARREYQHWDARHAAGDPALHCVAFEDSVLPVVRAERAVLVDDGHELDHGVTVEPCIGHTPGNVVIELRSGTDRGVFCGDVLHSPLQLADPSLSSRACWDLDRSREARIAFIERHADTGSVVMPAHFLAPSAGHIVRMGGAFGFLPVAGA